FIELDAAGRSGRARGLQGFRARATGRRYRLEPFRGHFLAGDHGGGLGTRSAGRGRDRGLCRAVQRQCRDRGGGRRKQRLSHPSRAAPARRGERAVSETVVIHTDGACSGNPGPGGWGAVLEYGGHVKELKGGAANTTNNQMELTAAIEALNALKRPCAVELYTDSQYVKNGIQGWLF